MGNKISPQSYIMSLEQYSEYCELKQKRIDEELIIYSHYAQVINGVLEKYVPIKRYVVKIDSTINCEVVDAVRGLIFDSNYRTKNIIDEANNVLVELEKEKEKLEGECYLLKAEKNRLENENNETISDMSICQFLINKYRKQ